jgi:hypothetical protein
MSYSNEMIAQANAMEAQGISTRRTVERLRAMFPDEPIPAQNSIAAWRRKLLENAHEEMEDNEVRISLRYDELIMKKADYLEEHIDTARLGEMALTAGLMRDKGFKRQDIKEKAKQTEAGQALVDAINRLADLSVPQLHDVIEGELA